MTTWNVLSMSCKKQDAGETDVVWIVDWLASDTDGVNDVRSGGRTEVNPVNPNDFIPYPNLTEQEVLNWIFEILGDKKTQIEQSLTEQLAYSSNPPVASLPLPWDPVQS